MVERSQGFLQALSHRDHRDLHALGCRDLALPLRTLDGELATPETDVRPFERDNFTAPEPVSRIQQPLVFVEVVELRRAACPASARRTDAE